MIKCKICDKELNPGNVQQGGCHMDCYNEEITVFKVYMLDDDDNTFSSTHYIERDPSEILGTLYHLNNGDDGNGVAIRKATMTHGMYIELPEFEGF